MAGARDAEIVSRPAPSPARIRRVESHLPPGNGEHRGQGKDSCQADGARQNALFQSAATPSISDLTFFDSPTPGESPSAPWRKSVAIASKSERCSWGELGTHWARNQS